MRKCPIWMSTLFYPFREREYFVSNITLLFLLDLLKSLTIHVILFTLIINFGNVYVLVINQVTRVSVE